MATSLSTRPHPDLTAHPVLRQLGRVVAAAFVRSEDVLVWIFLIGERISIARGMGEDNTKAQEITSP
jgi:hypothetical protein